MSRLVWSGVMRLWTSGRKGERLAGLDWVGEGRERKGKGRDGGGVAQGVDDRCVCLLSTDQYIHT